MRGELQQSSLDPELLQHLTGVPVSKDVVSAKVTLDFHEVRLRRRGLPRPRNPRLRVAYNAVLDIHISGADPRCQRQNDRGRIASRIRQQGGVFDRLSVQFGQPVNRSFIEESCILCISIAESVYFTIRGLLQTPGPAQIDHTQATADRFRNPLARELVGRRQEHDIYSGILHPQPRESLQRKSTVTCQLRIRFAQIAVSSTLSVALEEQRLFDSGVTRE